MYPKAKVYISLLVPTQLTPLNHRVHDINNLIMDMTCRMSRVCIIKHSLFGGRLIDKHGRSKKELESSSVYTNTRQKTEDTLHLGKSGIRIFAMNLKKTVLGKSRSESATRFNGGGGRGSYRRALEGNGSRRRSGGSHWRIFWGGAGGCAPPQLHSCTPPTCFAPPQHLLAPPPPPPPPTFLLLIRETIV